MGSGRSAAYPFDCETATDEPGISGLAVRWIVERTFGWLNRSRRLSKDFEALPETTEAWIRIAMIQLMIRRLTANN
jgi:putative transposase